MLKRAIIYWFSEEDGGRKKPPTGEEYYPTTELEDGSTWSLAIKFDRENPTHNAMVDHCEVCFLFDHIIYSEAVRNLSFMKDLGKLEQW